MENTEIKEKMREQLVGTGWDAKLRFFLIENKLDNILEQLKQDKEDGHRFTPAIRDVFKPFTSCHYDNVKIVFICDQPSMSPAYNDGLALSCAFGGESWGISKKVFAAINKTVYSDPERETDTKLDRWAEQGILLLNSSLTTRMEKERSEVHEKAWRPFVSYVINSLKVNENIIYVLLGAGSSWEDSLNENCVKFVFPNIWKTGEEWDESVFSKINGILEERGETIINW